ncbi:unnamed protein product [Heligmosomoides polygyrus]|uniref:ATP-grasp target RiPP n=1 Tax=Heligmosomoides polygyrus TaxID=6339 RepID=A0A183FEG5_HELPZ|nr:unnamed protein product [Heligmosomoides polygyrus]
MSLFSLAHGSERFPVAPRGETDVAAFGISQENSGKYQDAFYVPGDSVDELNTSPNVRGDPVDVPNTSATVPGDAVDVLNTSATVHGEP